MSQINTLTEPYEYENDCDKCGNTAICRCVVNQNVCKECLEEELAFFEG